MPTLLEVDKIIPQKWMPAAMVKQLKEQRSIDFIIDYVGDRIWLEKTKEPKVKPKTLGHKVLVLRSGTGSGKSTLLPPYLYKRYFATLHKNICITQPTIATATEIPYQIAQYNPELKLGENMGFQTGVIARKPIKGVLFCTVGIVLQFLKSMTDEEFMKKYAFVIIDEVHIRTMELDTTLYYLKQLLSRNYHSAECPFVILTSGTFDPEPFMRYFSVPKENFLDVMGQSYPIVEHYSKFTISNWTEYIIDLIEKIHVDNIDELKPADNATKSEINATNAAKAEINATKSETNVAKSEIVDILVFVQGAQQIKTLIDKIHLLNNKVFSKGVAFAKKHSDEQQKKYIGAGEDKLTYYLAPIALMSKNIQKGDKEYKDLYSNIDSVSVNIYKFNSEGERTEEIIETHRASRRVMFGTNAVETGLTIDTLKYCIDSGWVKESQYNPVLGCEMLLDKPITQSSCKQRRGRVGRKAPGVFYACYTLDSYNAMQPLPLPNIVREDIATFLLNCIIGETKTTMVISTAVDYDKEQRNNRSDIFQMNKLDQQYYELVTEEPFYADKLDFIQYPSIDGISNGIQRLHGLGMIDHEYKPTIIGYYASKFRKLKLENVRMILAGYDHGANILDLITIAASLEVGFDIGIQKRKYIPRDPLLVGPEIAAYYNKWIFSDEFIEYLFIWHDFMQIIDVLNDLIDKNSKPSNTKRSNKPTNKPSEILTDWCAKNNFKLDGLMKVIEYRDEIIADMLTMGLNPYYNGLNLPKGSYSLVKIMQRNLLEGVGEIKKIKHCILDSYRFNLFIWNPATNKYTSSVYHYELSIDSKIIKPITDVNIQEIQQIRPMKIIVSEVTIKENFFNKGTYEFTAGDVSIMDGYIDVDVEFLFRA